MSIKFWPSLELIAHARLAQGILYIFGLEDLKHTFPSTEHIQTISKKISELVLPTYCATFSRLTAARRNTQDSVIVHLPPELQKQLRGIVTAMDLEIKKMVQKPYIYCARELS
ncbi:uncharacterized protein TNIN_206881 [Trichonephila inaurata madagascariensis]|uniref:Uncharacterized protein n=1 Tax=Trichonephila inaurata madagascariensis TaxID=2747483 RepID=A0A8X6Y2H4_9ARAC|nr:uncharacterized protein TNIN_206881 [Trichonephila inaurata madagascariensis]